MKKDLIFVGLLTFLHIDLLIITNVLQSYITDRLVIYKHLIIQYYAGLLISYCVHWWAHNAKFRLKFLLWLERLQIKWFKAHVKGHHYTMYPPHKPTSDFYHFKTEN